MDNADLQRARRRLADLREDLLKLEQSSQDDVLPGELDQARVGRLSRMDAMQAQEMAQEAARRRQRLLVEVDGAMRRIDAGEYGCCFVCGEEIDTRRLAVDPTSTRCIRCAAS